VREDASGGDIWKKEIDVPYVQSCGMVRPCAVHKHHLRCGTARHAHTLVHIPLPQPSKYGASVPMTSWLNWIEQPPPKGQVAGSSPAGVTIYFL
jgi:hypothetical protein